jgi:hypothetical protein
MIQSCLFKYLNELKIMHNTNTHQTPFLSFSPMSPVAMSATAFSLNPSPISPPQSPFSNAALTIRTFFHNHTNTPSIYTTTPRTPNSLNMLLPNNGFQSLISLEHHALIPHITSPLGPINYKITGKGSSRIITPILTTSSTPISSEQIEASPRQQIDITTPSTPSTPTPRQQIDITAPTPTPRQQIDITAPTPTPRQQIDITAPSTPTPRQQIDITAPNTPTPRQQIDITAPSTPTPRQQIDITAPSTPTPRQQIDITAPSTPTTKEQIDITTTPAPPSTATPKITTTQPVTPQQLSTEMTSRSVINCVITTAKPIPISEPLTIRKRKP